MDFKHIIRTITKLLTNLVNLPSTNRESFGSFPGQIFPKIAKNRIFCDLTQRDYPESMVKSRTGNFNITVKNEKTDALISEQIDEITSKSEN